MLRHFSNLNRERSHFPAVILPLTGDVVHLAVRNGLQPLHINQLLFELDDQGGEVSALAVVAAALVEQHIDIADGLVQGTLKQGVPF